MCKAPDINPMTLKGRKDVRREEGGKQERKEERRRDKGNTNAEKPRPFFCCCSQGSLDLDFQSCTKLQQGCLVFVLPTGRQVIAG